MAGIPQTEIKAFTEETIVPILKKAEKNPELESDGMGRLKGPMSGGMLGFIALFLFSKSLLPNNTFGEVASFILFPILFFSIMALTAFLFRHRIARAMLVGRDNFLIRSEALSELCDYFDLKYIPIPGGPSKPTKFIAGLKYCPQILKEFCDMMEDHGGFDDVAETIRQSGLALPRDKVLASEKNREDIYQRQIENQQFEDGVKGHVNDIPFSALEWTEKLDESTRHHLLIAFDLPTRLSGRVEFKNKDGHWPAKHPSGKKKPVKLISKAFTKHYAVRAHDQMEARLIFDPAVIGKLTAYAAQDGVCGVAFDRHLVVDFVGRNRFDILNLATGDWSKESINAAIQDITDLYDFAETISNAFSVRTSFDTAARVNAA